MTDLRRSIKCSNCGTESTVYINSQFDLRDFLLSGRCSSCGNSLQISFNIIEKEDEKHPELPQAESSVSTVNLDDTLFGSDQPSDNLRDIMED